MIPTIDYTDARQLIADAQARRAMFYPPASRLVRIAPPPPPPAPAPAPSRSREPRVYEDTQTKKYWTTWQVETLSEMAADGRTSLEVADVIDRTTKAVEMKANELGIKVSRIRKPRRERLAAPQRPPIDWKAIAAFEQGRRLQVISRTVNLVATYALVSVVDIESHRRFAPAARARQIVFWLLRTCTTHSFPTIGRAIGGRDHTTVLHGWRKVSGLVERGGPFAADLIRMKGIVTAWWEANRALEDDAREAIALEAANALSRIRDAGR